ncbi:MAG TPA: hypothetical protein VGG64_16160 [Pirellulales bacterium]
MGAAFGSLWPIPKDIKVETISAKRIFVEDRGNRISIDGDTGISLNRLDYAAALLWFREPGTGSPGTDGPTLWIANEDGAFKATPSGAGVVPREDRPAPQR